MLEKLQLDSSRLESPGNAAIIAAKAQILKFGWASPAQPEPALRQAAEPASGFGHAGDDPMTQEP